MSSYEPNTEPYNDTGARWTDTPPTKPGFYWLLEPSGVTTVAWRMNSGSWFLFAYECDQHPSSEELKRDGVRWWSERIKEPHP